MNARNTPRSTLTIKVLSSNQVYDSAKTSPLWERSTSQRPVRGPRTPPLVTAVSVRALTGFLLVALTLVSASSPTSAAQPADLPVSTRTLKICVAANAPAEIQDAAKTVLAAVGTQPLLQAMAGAQAPAALTDSVALAAAKPTERAYSHLILVGLPDDPMIAAAWQREALVETGGFYVFGFGHVRGDLGYIESDRNPFLHSWAIARAPYETEVVTLTGSTPQGVVLAVQAFLKGDLVNGLVAAPGWTRPDTSLLDRDPLPAGFGVPGWIPASAGNAQLAGLTEASEDEYRGVLDDIGAEPAEIWRAKYYIPGAWDGPGSENALADYANGLHRRATGDTLWAARFASPQAAAEAARKLAAEGHMTAGANGAPWQCDQPGYSKGASPGPMFLWSRGAWVLMSTLPMDVTAALVSAVKP